MTGNDTPERQNRGGRPVSTAIEATWLVGLFLVPIAYSGPDMVVLFLQPKDFILHFTALLIVSLWGFEWAIGVYQQRSDFGAIPGIRRWPGLNPGRWALTAAAGYGLAVILSTLFSASPAISLWGRDFSALGYDLYSVLSFLTIFFAIALRVRSEGQVRRILWAIAGAGVVTGAYGISQHFGWDPIGNGAGGARVISTFANPIFFGSYLLMSTVVTVGLALDNGHRWHRWQLLIVIMFLTVQLAAMWFTGSRGPWIGLIFGLMAFAGLGTLTLGRVRMAQAGAVMAIAVVLAVLVIRIPVEAKEGETRSLGSIAAITDPTAGTLGRRTDIWQGGVRLLDSWEVQASQSAVAGALRPILASVRICSSTRFRWLRTRRRAS